MKVGLSQTFTPEVLKNIIDFYGFEVSELKEIFSYENFVYLVNHKEKEYYLRISHGEYNSVSHVKAEIEWIHYLRDNNIDVVTILPSKKGNYVEEVRYKDHNFISVLFEKIDGENFTENLKLLTPDRMRQWGKLVAKLHLLSVNYLPSDPKITRLHIAEDSLLGNVENVLKEYPQILQKVQRALSETSELPKSNEVYGLIHRDLHEANLIIHEGKMTIIDFDDSHYNWYIADIAIILFHYAWRFGKDPKSRNQIIKEFFPIFMDGYLSENNLDQFWIDKIPLFIKLRHFSLFCTLVYELKIEFDEWSNKILEGWVPFLQNDERWITLSP